MSRSGKFRVLLSFAEGFEESARCFADEIIATGVAVRYDVWQGGGGVPGRPAMPFDPEGSDCVVPLLTPSEIARTWIGPEWRRTVHDVARRRGMEILPVRLAGDPGAVPDFLSDRSHANLCGTDRSIEFRRLIATMRRLSGNGSIELPEEDSEATSSEDPEHPLVLEGTQETVRFFEAEGMRERFFREMVPMMRDGLFHELGVPFPDLRMRTAEDVAPWSLRVVINGIPEKLIQVRPGHSLVSERPAILAEKCFESEAAVNPASGGPCAWISHDRTDAAERLGLTTWDAPGFVILSLSALLRRKAAAFVGLDQAKEMLAKLKPVFPRLVAETVPAVLSCFAFTEILRRLVAEEISIRDLRRILMILATWARVEKDPAILAEYVRAGLRRQISHKFGRGQNRLIVFLLDPVLEDHLRNSQKHTGSCLDLGPDEIAHIIDTIRTRFDAIGAHMQAPQILTKLEIRSAVRRLLAPTIPQLHVLSYQEIDPRMNIHPLGRISLDQDSGAHKEQI